MSKMFSLSFNIRDVDLRCLAVLILLKQAFRNPGCAIYFYDDGTPFNGFNTDKDIYFIRYYLGFCEVYQDCGYHKLLFRQKSPSYLPPNKVLRDTAAFLYELFFKRMLEEVFSSYEVYKEADFVAPELDVSLEDVLDGFDTL